MIMQFRVPVNPVARGGAFDCRVGANVPCQRANTPWDAHLVATVRILLLLWVLFGAEHPAAGRPYEEHKPLATRANVKPLGSGSSTRRCSPAAGGPTGL